MPRQWSIVYTRAGAKEVDSQPAPEFVADGFVSTRYPCFALSEMMDRRRESEKWSRVILLIEDLRVRLVLRLRTCSTLPLKDEKCIEVSHQPHSLHVNRNKRGSWPSSDPKRGPSGSGEENISTFLTR